MQNSVLQLDPRDNVLVALTALRKGQQIPFSGNSYTLLSDIPAKQKFVTRDLGAGDQIVMYGGLVGTATEPIRQGDLLSTRNIRHAASDFHSGSEAPRWTPPDVSAWRERTFLGYHRSDGQVGTRNYWLVVPLVFCENRNLSVLKQAFEEELGFALPQIYRRHVAELVRLYAEGKTEEQVLLPDPPHTRAEKSPGLRTRDTVVVTGRGRVAARRSAITRSSQRVGEGFGGDANHAFDRARDRYAVCNQ